MFMNLLSDSMSPEQKAAADRMDPFEQLMYLQHSGLLETVKAQLLMKTDTHKAFVDSLTIETSSKRFKLIKDSLEQVSSTDISSIAAIWATAAVSEMMNSIKDPNLKEVFLTIGSSMIEDIRNGKLRPEDAVEAFESLIKSE